MRLREPLVGRSRLHPGERLVAADTARGELEHGLEERHDPARRAQQRLDLLTLLARQRAAGEARAVAAGLLAAAVLGRIERGVGGGEQLGGPDGVGGMRGDAGRALERLAADHDLGHRGARPLGHLARLGGLHPRQHEHELLATESADRVRLAHDRAQALGGGGQHAVALGMAVAVVDALEVIEVEHHDAHGGGRLQGRSQLLLRAAVVEQPGEPVRLGHVALAG